MTMNTPRKLFLLSLGLIAAGVYGWMSRSPFENGIWRINFAPAGSPKVASFVNVGGDADYHSGKGYGWLNVDGKLQAGHWPGDKGRSWESRRGLNVVARRGPDDLARSFASGSASFGLDLVPGDYEIWVLSGDSGHLEFTPSQSYRILVEGQEAYRYDITSQQYYRELETPLLDDDLSQSGVWQRYIEPRFKWASTRVTVSDGQLNIEVEAPERETDSVELAGDYPYTEISRGPKQRFAGAINALLVIARDQDADRGAQVVADVDSWRRQNFEQKWPLQSVRGNASAAIAAGDRERGYNVYVPGVQEQVFPDSPLPHQQATLSLRATAGEFVPLTLAIRPLVDLGETRVELSGMYQLATGDDIAPITTPIAFDVVRYMARPTPGDDAGWRPTPVMIAPVASWSLVKNVSKQFWLSYQVPETLVPGHYRAVVTIKPEHAVASQLDVELEVLPFHLQRPTQLSLGMTYFSPVQDGRFDEERYWRRMAAEFADMRAHGFTMVQYTGVGIDDYDRLDRVFRLYREAGFEQPLALLESYGAMDRLRRDGIAWDTEEFYDRYKQSIRDLLDAGAVRGWPPFIVNFGDEFTNTALEEFGVKVARSLKQIPGIVTAADTNGAKEVRLMAPEVDILVFNNGWAGPDGVNGDEKLLHKGTVAAIKAAGAEPWLVNIGTDRFSSGYWLWKMVSVGVVGKIEWLYRGYSGMPYNSFDASPMATQLVFPGPGDSMIHALDYERMRIGFTDLAYINTLELMVASARDDIPALAAAKAFLRRLDGLIDDDMNQYFDDDSKQWSDARYATLRNEAIDHIVQLRASAQVATEAPRRE
jgi:hypothetical protein